MLTAEQQAQASKKLHQLQAEQKIDRNRKAKIKNVTKGLNDILKTLGDTDTDALSKLQQNTLLKFLNIFNAKNQILINAEDKLKSQKDQLNRDKIIALEDTEKYNKNIEEIKETVIKIKKAIEESVKQQADKRKKIQDDLDKSIVQIKQKITTFQKESEELEKQNEGLRTQKQEILKKMNGLEEEFKAKISSKDESASKDKENLMNNLKEVQTEVNEASQCNKQFGELEKKNFDNKLSIYFRTKKLPQISNSMETSATTIEKYKQQLTKGVQRLVKAQQTIKKCEAEGKEINDKCIGKLKIKDQKNEKMKKLKAEKEQIRQRILQLQNAKKQKQATKTSSQ